MDSAPRINYRPATERAGTGPQRPQPLTPQQQLLYLVQDREALAAGSAEAARFACSLPGGLNAAWLWWLLTKIGLTGPYIPDGSALLAYLHLRGMTALLPEEEAKATDLFVGYDPHGRPRFGVVAKAGTEQTAWFMALDETQPEPYRLEKERVAYYLRLPGG